MVFYIVIQFASYPLFIIFYFILFYFFLFFLGKKKSLQRACLENKINPFLESKQ